jgi:RPA family protein
MAIEQMQQLKRSIAHKVFLSDVANLPFVRGDGTTSSYLQHGDLQIGRTNVMGTIIQKQGNASAAIEDHTAQMQLRLFEESGILHNIEIGDVVQVIGRPREYGQDRYILPEVVKKIDAGWLKVRNKEIKALSGLSEENIKASIAGDTDQKNNANTVQNVVESGVEAIEGEKITESPSESICFFIKNNDMGEGVDIQSIVESRVVDNVEKHIQMLLRNGDIFEIRPGRVKVLE